MNINQQMQIPGLVEITNAEVLKIIGEDHIAMVIATTTIASQRTEINRLKEVTKGGTEQICKLAEEKAELQKRVDELTKQEHGVLWRAVWAVIPNAANTPVAWFENHLDAQKWANQTYTGATVLEGRITTGHPL